MNFIPQIIYIISIYYFITIIRFIWGNLQSQNSQYSNTLEPVSVIVALRNGEKNLPRLLDQLSNQQYKQNIEYLIVDDKSSDKTKSIILEKCSVDSRFNYIHSSEGSHNYKAKKRALDAGIKNAKYDILLFTDVDCIVQPLWVDSMSKSFSNDIDYVIGYSYTLDHSTTAAKFQSIDFLMLMYSARAMANFKTPWACSGQNQAFKKQLYTKVNGYDNVGKIKYGDDTLFMQICRKANANIVFCQDSNSHTQCRSETSWISLIKQRLRWASDANDMYRYNFIFFLSILSTFLINSFILFGLLFIEFNQFFIILSIKIFLESLLYYFASSASNIKLHFPSFLIWSIIQIPYIFFMGIGSFFANKIQWRDEAII